MPANAVHGLDNMLLNQLIVLVDAVLVHQKVRPMFRSGDGEERGAERNGARYRHS